METHSELKRSLKNKKQFQARVQEIYKSEGYRQARAVKKQIDEKSMWLIPPVMRSSDEDQKRIEELNSYVDRSVQAVP